MLLKISGSISVKTNHVDAAVSDEKPFSPALSPFVILAVNVRCERRTGQNSYVFGKGENDG
ncbi:hypothetical protein C1J03_18925 [Sulfitobacter sp. SK012]|nr:hypothetical protein C1J03_18925 [Sulfitobacter sp. SK012]